MNSPAHKANLLKGSFTKVGIGVAKGMYNGRETTFVVQFFANPAMPEQASAHMAKPKKQLIKDMSITEQVVEVASTDKNAHPKVLGESFIPNKAVDDMTTIVLNEAQDDTSISKDDTSTHTIKSIAKEKFIELASSPSVWYMPLLLILFSVFLLIFLKSFHIHITKHNVESMVMAVSILVILAGIVNFNFGHRLNANISNNNQYASVSIITGGGFYYK